MKLPLLKHSLRVTLAVLALSTVATGFARKLSPDEAIQRANEFQQASAASQFRTPNRISAHGNVMRPDNLSLAYTAEKVGAENTPAFYVFNNSAVKDGGFIIATGDDRLRPVLAVVDNGTFDPQNLPDNLRWWLSQYEEEINAYLSSPVALAAEMSASASTSVDNYKEWEEIPFLLASRWDQFAPYNDLCPMASSTERSVTGCTATAFAQVIYYHRYADLSKVKGTTKTYTTTTTRTRVSYTFPEKFDFENMLDDYSTTSYNDTQGHAVADLMLACGVMINMDYSSVSGAWPGLATIAAIENMGYDKSSRTLRRSGYQTAEWEKIIYNELKNSRPMVYCGFAYDGGHTFVCDGYSGGGLFHINWGWSGSSDGAYALSALNPGEQGIGSYEGGYNNKQELSIFVKPGQQGPDLPDNVVCLAENLTISGSRVKMTYAFTSAIKSPYSTSVGLKLTDENGNQLSIAGQANTTSMQPAGSTYSSTITPSYTNVSMPAGKYYLVAVYKDGNSQWVEMPPASPSGTNRVLVTVSSSGTKTLSAADSEYTSVLSWVLENDDEFYMASPNNAIISVRNVGNGDYTDNLYARFTNASNSSQVFDVEVSSGATIAATLVKQFDVTIDMSSKKYAAGEWTVRLGKKNGNQMTLLEGQQKITINEGTVPVVGNPTLPDVDVAIDFHEATPREWIRGEKFMLWFNIIVNNPGDLTYFAFLIYERGTNTLAEGPLGINLGYQSQSLATGFEYSTNVPAGLYDFVFYTYDNGVIISPRIPISVGGTTDGVTYSLALDGSCVKIQSWNNTSQDITIPEQVTLDGKQWPVTKIPVALFQDSPITSASIASTVKSIGSKAFHNTKKLENVYFYGSCPIKFAETAFMLTNPEVNVYVNEADYDDYKTSFANVTENVYSRIDNWSLETDKITIKEGESVTLMINRDVTSNFNPGVTVADGYNTSVAEISPADDGNAITVTGLKTGTTEVTVSLAQANLPDAKIKITVRPDDDMFDVNADGDINVADIATMVSYVLEEDSDKLSGCDFNNDNVVNVGDINFAVNYIVGGGAENLGSSLGSGIKSLPVDFGYHGRYIAMQADLRIEGDGLLRFIELNKALAGSHILSWGRPENGVVRVMIYSLKNSLINLAEGSPIFTLGIEGSLDIECIKLMYVDENLNIINVTPTSVGSVEADSEIVSEEYFDLTGRRLREAAGVCLRRAIHADGTISVTKISR